MKVRCSMISVALLLLAGALRAQDPVVAAGPMVGYAEETEVMLWAQTVRPARVRVRFWPEASPGAARTGDEVLARPEVAHCVHLRLDGLPWGTRFQYRLVVDGEEVAPRHPQSFQTQPHWRWRTDPPSFTVAIGSCAYLNEPTWDRPGPGYGGDPKIFESIAATQPDLMLWLGDNLYYREPDWTSEAAMRRRYSRNRACPELQRLLAATHHYAIWDDHDYGPNDSDWTFRRRAASLRTFKSFWANPHYGLEETPGVFFRFTWGDAEFFMLDDRYHRSPNAAPRNRAKTMFGATQLRWLLDALSNSQATFKVVVGGNQLINPMTPYEAMRQFPPDEDAIFTGLFQRKIDGVFFLSGDRHHAELLKVRRSLAYDLYEYTSSPLLSGMHTMTEAEIQNPARVPGTLVADRRNFGLLRFSGAADDRSVVLECRDPEGALIWARSLEARELVTPR